MKRKTAVYTYYYGLPNAAAQAYFACKHLLAQEEPLLFVSTADLDDFDHAAHTFAPEGTRLLSFPMTDTGQMFLLHQLLKPTKHPMLLSANYEALQTPLPHAQDFQTRTHVLRRGDTLRRQEVLELLEQAGYTAMTMPKPPANTPPAVA